MALFPRSSGILLHPTSLPGRFGVGDLGEWSYRFVDYLHNAGQSIWQILPLGPTGFGESPYQALSSFAGNTNLISLDEIVKEGWLKSAELENIPYFSGRRVDFPLVIKYHDEMLSLAYDRFVNQGLAEQKQDFEAWHAENAFWLEDFALFIALKEFHGGQPWVNWTEGEVYREKQALGAAWNMHACRIAEHRFRQWVFYRQWERLKKHANDRGIQIIGDVPIYVAHDSCDVWVSPELFELDFAGHPIFIAGVPPDYFSTNGQLWGHPVYRWDAHRETRYEWWIRRFARNLALFDYVRIDHFRGLVAYWEVPADEPTAVNGRWLQAPAEDFFNELRHRFVCLPLIAEDLGVITADVRETMQRFGFPGMRVLMFGFSEDPATNANAIHNIPENCVVFTGTHDNNTVKGWLENEASALEKRRLGLTLGREPAVDELHWGMIRLAMMSPARMCITPVQDLLGLGPEARINTPGRWEGNWLWRMSPSQFAAMPQKQLLELTEAFGRR